MDVANFFTKWSADMTDAQFETGGIPSTVPFCPSIPNEGGPAWSDAAIICPWTIYLCYGDKRVLEERWGMMTKFMNFLRESSNNLIRADETNKWRGYGDWLSHNAETPNDLIGTAFFAFDAKLMSKMARAIGKTDDATKYEKLFEDVRAAWLKRYVTPGGMIIGQSQTSYVLSLHFDLLPEDQRPRAFEALVRDIEKRGMHLSTGFVGTPYLLDVLTRFGRIDVAYALLMQKTFPSWLFPVTHGATTMWERWDGWTPEKGFNDAGMNSYNHYAYGAVGAWMYSTVAGIDLDPQKPAYKSVLIQPRPGNGITWARAKLESIYGSIESSWRVEGGKLKLDVTIPPNTTATVRVPTSDGASVSEASESGRAPAGVKPVESTDAAVTFELGAGRYAFTSRYAV
jgi:alpha-L-rhamnosidase